MAEQTINGTNGDMMISFDGVTDKVPVLANTFNLYDLISDEDSNESFRYQNGAQLWIRYTAMPASGTFYGIEIYGKGE